MEMLKSLYQWLQGPNGLILVAVLLGLSEALAQIPFIKSNSVFQAIVNGIKFIKDKLAPKA